MSAGRPFVSSFPLYDVRGEVTSDVARGSSVAGVCVWVGFLASLPSVRRLGRRLSVRPVRVGPEGSVQQRLARPKADHAMKIDLFRFLAQTSARDRVASSSSRLLWRSQGALLFLHLISTSLLALVRCARCSQQPAGGTTRRLGPPFRPSSPDGWVDGWVRYGPSSGRPVPRTQKYTYGGAHP